MVYAGIDVGSKNVHITFVKDSKVILKDQTQTGIYKSKAAEELFKGMLKQAEIKKEDVKRIITTGGWGESITFADGYVPDMTADAYCIHKLFPEARTVIGVGAETIRVTKLDSQGMVFDFAINEKCAAGNGTFIDAMARALEITTPQMAEISLQSTRDIHVNAQCAVFGESEVISLIHQEIPKPDIARAVHNAVARRIGAIAKGIGLEKEVIMIGGAANNKGLVELLKKELNMEINIPEAPGFIGSIGAAYAAEAGVSGKDIKSKDTGPLGPEDTSQNYTSQKAPTDGNNIEEFWKWPETHFVNPDIDWKKGEFITAGIDVGSVSIQTAIMVDGELFAFSNTRTGFSSPDSAREGLSRALAETEMTVEDIDYCISTGYGRVNIPIAQQTVSEIACIARGANFYYGPEVRTIIDIGGQDCKVIRCDEKGKVVKFVMNDKCAAGTGRGMEVFADLLRVPIWEIGPRSFQIEEEPTPIEDTCVLFAKSEIMALLEAGMPENEAIAAYCMAMANRITLLVNRLGVEKELCITGGISKNEGVVKRIEQELGVKVMEAKWHNTEYLNKDYPFDAQVIGVTGAALHAFDLWKQGKVKSHRVNKVRK